MLKNFDEVIELLKSQPVQKKIGVVAAHDEHTLEAVAAAATDGIVKPILIGNEEKIREIANKINFDISKAEIINELDDIKSVQLAADMVNRGELNAIMKGKILTGSLMKVLVNKETGIRKNDVMSIVAFMESPFYHKIFAITDPGLLTYPNYEQKYQETVNAVEAFQTLGIKKPKVAIVAAVETVNEKMPETVDADAIKTRGIEGAIIEGPISLDLALSKEVAQIKNYKSDVAGDADILVVPDIASGNIAAKFVTVLGNGRTGGVVIGAKVPILIVSRAATSDDKYMSIVFGALLGNIN